jgi:hypothetical protein
MGRVGSKMRDVKMRDTALTRWMMRRSTWAYVSSTAAFMFVLILAIGEAKQLIFGDHDFSGVLGSAVGGSLAFAIMSYWFRVNYQGRQG